MTPEEILNDYFRDSENDVDDAYEIAIEAIKQYAREMCDAQKKECLVNWNNIESGCDLKDYNAINDAPYPKQLL